MNQPTTKEINSFLKAAKNNDVAKLKDFIAQGVPIESRDGDGKTALMCAADAGCAEAFHALVVMGADLNVVGLAEVDLLEYAAGGGNLEIVAFLLDKGLPIEGHWNPRSDFARRQGHMTPLMYAAIEGHAGIVRLLLERGADRGAKFDGETAEKLAAGQARLAKFEGNAEAERKLLEVAALLKARKGKTVKAAEPYDVAAAVAKFAANARQASYIQALNDLTERLGSPTPWKPMQDHGIAAEGVFQFKAFSSAKRKTLASLFKIADDAACLLVLANVWTPGEKAVLVLFPTDDNLAVAGAVGVEGANEGIKTSDVIEWLQETDRENPFALRACGHDHVGGEFLGAIKNAKRLAERLVEFCPTLADAASTAAIAKQLSKSKEFALWWG